MDMHDQHSAEDRPQGSDPAAAPNPGPAMTETHLITETPPPPVTAAPVAMPVEALSAHAADHAHHIGWVPMALLSVASTVLGAVLALLLLARMNNGVLEFQSRPGVTDASSAATVAAQSSEFGQVEATVEAPPAALSGVDITATAMAMVEAKMTAEAGAGSAASGAAQTEAMTSTMPGMGAMSGAMGGPGGMAMGGSPMGMGMTGTMGAENTMGMGTGMSSAGSMTGAMGMGMPSGGLAPTQAAAAAAKPEATATLLIASSGGSTSPSQAARPAATQTLTPTLAAAVAPTATRRAPRSARPTPTLIIAAP